MHDSLHQRIQEYAYMIWLDEGQPHGRDLDHWREAERKLSDYSVAQSDVPRAGVAAPTETASPGPAAKTDGTAKKTAPKRTKELKENPQPATGGRPGKKAAGDGAVREPPRK